MEDEQIFFTEAGMNENHNLLRKSVASERIHGCYLRQKGTNHKVTSRCYNEHDITQHNKDFLNGTIIVS
jgi:hypothetical protein